MPAGRFAHLLQHNGRVFKTSCGRPAEQESLPRGIIIIRAFEALRVEPSEPCTTGGRPHNNTWPFHVTATVEVSGAPSIFSGLVSERQFPACSSNVLEPGLLTPDVYGASENRGNSVTLLFPLNPPFRGEYGMTLRKTRHKLWLAPIPLQSKCILLFTRQELGGRLSEKFGPPFLSFPAQERFLIMEGCVAI